MDFNIIIWLHIIRNLDALNELHPTFICYDLNHNSYKLNYSSVLR